MRHQTEAYLDIETTGLSPGHCRITVIGIHICKGQKRQSIQLVGDEISDFSLMNALEGVDIIYTYNGSRFDLPFIFHRLGVNLSQIFKHQDLMYDCWRNNLRGGFKAVEKQLGINRKLKEISGFDAIKLWWRYVNDYDEDALSILLEYNKEDVVNLKTLKDILL